MANFFNSVRITNFKSLKDVTLSDCKRINVLIGKPNVGKSNILEAIGLFSLPYFQYNKSKKLTQFVRLENLAELFFDGNVREKIIISADDKSSCVATYLENLDFVQFEIKPSIDYGLEINQIMVDDSFNLGSSYHFSEKEIEDITKKTLEEGNSQAILHLMELQKLKGFSINKRSAKNFFSIPKVKLYKFPHNLVLKKKSVRHYCLIPPSGINLLEAIQECKIDKDLVGLFAEYGLKLLFDKTNNTLRVMKTLKDGNSMVSFPYSSVADTLQRVIFFKTAIASNKNSILLFEEPEAHCFPPYIRQITQDILDSETNQFFIATHSPYVLNDFLEYERNDVAIFIANFKNGETVIRRLTDEEVNDVYQYGIDLFFNHELFTDDQEH